MGDWGLEDKYLRRNIPGRYNHWDPDSDDELKAHREDAEFEEEDEPPVQPPPGPLPEAMRYGEAPGARRGGPKGQIAQYNWFKRMEYQEKLAAKAEREATLLRIATGTVRDPDAPLPVAEAAAADNNDDDDDEFIRAYRERRLRELKEDASKPVFGALRRDLTKDEYLAAITADPRIVVVLHIHDPRLPPCRRLEAILEVVAARRPDISFVSMTVDELGDDFDTDVMPILALYKAAEVADTLFRVTDNLDPHSEHDDLERLLDDCAVFAVKTQQPAPR
ncbi:hypothetical protein CTAYLR_010381 [Chrysophaeum taylorii]|uniref:Phosducin domain-containing protein n=1 Tax=Chrysophaeum taylorii TaxID=2483200 RepID=A0AAD7XL20_9STRA|nr:hypothetical protein CTAYLR_010381 [Chrysophaeum taylorii]